MSKNDDLFLDRLLEQWEPGTQGKDSQKRKEIAKHALQWLRDRRAPATAENFKEALYEDNHIDGQSRDTWWRTIIRPVLRKHVGPREAHLVEYKHGRHEYRWVGEPDTHLRGYKWVNSE